MWYAINIAAVVAAVAISYGLALAGHPESLWLWRDVLGVVI